MNYWEPWYLGFDPQGQRPAAGLPTADNPRTGPYKVMRERGMDLHELQAQPPRSFFGEAGGAEDPQRWVADHTVAVNLVLGFRNRVGMSTRPTHDPTPESNAQLVAFFAHFLQR